MNRLTRIFAAALLSAAMLVVLTPAAQARPLGKPQPGLAVDGSWFDAALSWLTQLLGAPQPPAARNAREKDGTVPTGGGGGGFTGSCIDPNGCLIVARPGQGATNSTGGK
ncbi:MAG TPA: hypothetical protein VG477_16935 [Thermoanaerobaculia bacterium]|nr:hypothetical protein [Thermoanaerobaculia bacterium]